MPLRVTMSDSSINGDAIFRDKSIVQLFFGHTLFVNINVEVAFLNMKLSHVEKEKKLPRVVKGEHLLPLALFQIVGLLLLLVLYSNQKADKASSCKTTLP